MTTLTEMAKEAGFKEHNGMIYVTTINDDCAKELKAFAALVRADERSSWPAEMEAMERQVNILTDALAQAKADEREACARVAGWLWQRFQDTKDAHERNSMEPFKWDRFGFDQSTVQQSKRMMDAIRARGDKT